MSDNPIVDPGTPAIPTPSEPPAPPVDPIAEAPKPKTVWTHETAAPEIEKLRREAAEWRTKYRDAEPIVEAHNKAEEDAKTEVQRATERATAAEKLAAEREAEANLLRAASKHQIPEEDWDLLGSGTPEELDARAARLAARYSSGATPTPPPSNRPVEGLRPGASPTPPAPPDTSYPAAWAPRARS